MFLTREEKRREEKKFGGGGGGGGGETERDVVVRIGNAASRWGKGATE